MNVVDLNEALELVKYLITKSTNIILYEIIFYLRFVLDKLFLQT